CTGPRRLGASAVLLRREGLILGDAVYEDGFIVNVVELVGGVSVDVDLNRARREFGNDNSDWSGSDGIGPIRLLEIKRAASVVISRAARVDRIAPSGGCGMTAPTGG